jgi:hypothetical protein
MSCCACYIIPPDVLNRLSANKRLDAKVRRAAAESARITAAIKQVRIQAVELCRVSTMTAPHFLELAAKPQITVYDCKGSQSLPGVLVAGQNHPRTQRPREHCRKRLDSQHSTNKLSIAIRSMMPASR